MGQVTAKLRKTTHGFAWWCPACEEAHPLPYGRDWTFDGNLEAPTFTPSFKHDWNWGPMVKPGKREGLNVCHYIITAGQVAYCGDCTHAMAGKTIPMPDLPPHLRDDYDHKM
jgi:hypothetical protein